MSFKGKDPFDLDEEDYDPENEDLDDFDYTDEDLINLDDLRLKEEDLRYQKVRLEDLYLTKYDLKELASLDEMYVREQGKEYYLLPVHINRNAIKNGFDTPEFVRSHYTEEIANCLICFLSDCYQGNINKFIVQSNRKKNIKLLKELGYDLSTTDQKKFSDNIRILARKLSKLFKSVYFFKDYCVDGTHCYTFKVPVDELYYSKVNYKPNTKSYVYLKFSFIYNYRLDCKDEKYISAQKYCKGNLFIYPKELVLNQISIHKSRNSKSYFDKYMEWLHS